MSNIMCHSQLLQFRVSSVCVCVCLWAGEPRENLHVKCHTERPQAQESNADPSLQPCHCVKMFLSCLTQWTSSDGRWFALGF